MSKKRNGGHICPVCRKFTFERDNSYEFCEVCGWQDCWYQEVNPDEDCLANIMSLNQAKAAYARGEEIQ